VTTDEVGTAGAQPGSESRAGDVIRLWTVALVVGELVGFVPAAVTGATLAAAGASDLWLVAGLTVAGTIEGVVIGIAQALVLARFAPSVDGRAWILATAVAAGFAWFVGMGGAAVLGSGAAPGVLLVALVPAWSVALVGMGFLQWRVLRRTVPRSGRWVPVTTGAWLVGVLIPAVVLSVVPNGWPPAAHAVAGVIGALAMGLTVGLLTGRTLARLLGHRTI
jgi:hypothetical protein